MMYFALAPVVFTLALLHSPTWSFANDGQAKAQIELSEKEVGKRVELRLQSVKKGETTKLIGRLKKVGNKSVVLEDVTKRVQVEQGVPLLRGIPVVSRLFKNVGIGQEKLAKDLTVKLKQVEAVRILDEKPE